MRERTGLPDWLLKTEQYTPQRDRDAFVNKSILALFGLLARIRAQDTARISAAGPGAAVVPLAFTLLLAVLLSASRSLFFVCIVLVGLLVRLSMMKAETIWSILKPSLVFTLFTALILLPAALAGNAYSIIMITPKVFATITAMSLLSHSCRWDALTAALKFFYVPDLFVFVLDIAVKYILMLGEFTLNMLYALKLRSVGRNAGKNTALSGVAGTLFLKSRGMAEDMHAAMQCRGFTGEYRRGGRLRLLAASDGLFLLGAAALVALFVYFGRQ